MADEVRAVCFPKADAAFVEHVEGLIQVPAGEPLVAAVQALLRDTYPLARIWPRQDIAALDRRTVWYVYRDGAVLGPVDADGQ